MRNSPLRVPTNRGGSSDEDGHYHADRGPGDVSLREPNYAVVTALREDGSPHQTVIWIDWDGEHVLLNLNQERAKLRYLRDDPRVSLLVLHRENPYHWLGIDGEVVEITTDGAYEHIVRQSGVYVGRDSYPLKPGEERVLVKVRPLQLEPYGFDD